MHFRITTDIEINFSLKGDHISGEGSQQTKFFTSQYSVTGLIENDKLVIEQTFNYKNSEAIHKKLSYQGELVLVEK